jgi:GT2 family glycosyltransferase
MGDAGAGAWIVVPAFGRPETTRRALRSLRGDGDHRVILVDDEGHGHGEEIAEEFPGIDVLRTATPVFWTGAIRHGAERALAAGATGVLLFNQDVTVEPGFLERLEETRALFPDAIIGCAVVYAHERETVWSAGARMEWFGRGFRVLFHGKPVAALPERPFPVDWVHGMGTWVPAGVFTRIGLPDADRFPMAWGDADFGLRARAAGIPVVVDPRLRLVHDVGEYDARVAGAPRLREYLSWLANDRHNLSLSAQREIWRRHGPRGLWPVSFAFRIGFLLANYVRIRLLFGRRTAPS